MIAHFIQHKGKGIFVVLVPLLLGFAIAVVVDGFSLTDKYVGPITFFISGIILFLLDNKRQKITEGILIERTIRLPRVKRKNTFMWIEVRYWGILISLIGIIWLINL